MPLTATASLVTRAREALFFDRAQLATAIGSSVRTISRWQAGQTSPADFELVRIAKVVYPKNRTLAAEIAAAVGQSLVSLGLEKPAPVVAPSPVAPPPPTYPITPQHLANTLLCAAAEALDMSPRAMRPALAAMLKTMRELGVSAAVAEEGLRAPEPPATKPRRATT